MNETPLIKRERQVLTLTRQALTSMPVHRVEGKVAPLIVASTRGVSRLVLTQAQLDDIALLPKKVASQVKRLQERGWFQFAKTEMRAGRNPASKGWLRVFCAKLIKGGIERDNLVLALSESLDLSPASARVQASVGISIFAAGRLATERFGKFELHPN
jgi:hypothetical protein